ncbi:uncharacterized protein [Neodiprion pinetum]|uniref:uncharacterized protein n=1 Tax=Neodiprion pinetum TaxID=441929 RepID=UPI001EE126D0|nr:uncharacterized protein LOC124214791 [Neodiprion pinetum]
MNAPTLQKQPEKARETRSVRLIDDSLEHNPKSVELTDEMRSKIHRGFDDPNVRDNSRESDEKWSNFRRNSIRRDHHGEKFKGRESADADLSKQNDDYRRSRYNWRKSDRGLSPSRRHHLNRLKQQRSDETRDFIHEQNGLEHVARNPDESSRFKDARFVDQGKTMPFDGTKRVLDENAEDPASIKPKDDNQKKKFKVLLAADNMEDESQMDLALHGELAGKIVERIFDQVQVNNALKVALGPGLFRKHKSEDAVQTDKTYRRGLDEDEASEFHT